MGRFKLTGVALLGAVLIGMVFYLRHNGAVRPTPAVTGSERVTTERQPLAPMSQVPAAPARRQAKGAKGASHSDFRQQFSSATNYWDYAHTVLTAAKAGDADAELYLSKALGFCDYANRAYFHQRGAKLTLDQALQLAAKQKRPAEETQAIYDRCHDFLEQDATELGGAAEWLKKATKAGQPVAEATTAQMMYSQDYGKSFLKAGAAPTPENSAAPIGEGLDPRALLLASVKSLDPEALFEIGLAQGTYELLHPPSEGKDVNQLAWMLVACQRGFDCSGNADWITTGCPNCGTRTPPGQSPDNTMMTIAGDSWPAVQQRAQEISAKLDGGQWAGLDLGPS